MKDQQPVEALSFESAFQELESIVNQLEEEERTLEEALELFERGQTMAKHCAFLLDQAELKVQQIVEMKRSPLREKTKPVCSASCCSTRC